MVRARRSWATFAAVACVGGCARVDPQPDYRRVGDAVQAATGAALETPLPEDAAVAAEIERLTHDGLTADEAVRVCLFANPAVRSALLQVGVARAAVVQSGLFSNPGVALALRQPDGGGLGELEVALAQGIADLWLIPIRTAAAEGELQRQILEAARAISALALATRAAYFTAVGADRELEIAGQNRDVARQLVDAAAARRAAGVGSDIDVNLARAELMQTEVASRAAELAAFDARRRLATLLGVQTPPDALRLLDELPDPPAWTLTTEQLLATARAHRLDLRAAAVVVDTAAAQVRRERLSVFADVEVGVSFERSARGGRRDRPWLADALWASAEAGQPMLPSLRPREKLATDTLVGPTLSFKLPLFDQNQAGIARAELQHARAWADARAAVLNAEHETRAAEHRARTAWELSRYYRDSFVPLLTENLELARAAYRGGKLSLLAVLEAQKALLAARGRAVQAQRDGAVALAELEQALGIPLERLAHGAAAPEFRPAATTRP